MNPHSKTLRAGLLLAALFTLSAAAWAADPAKPQDTPPAAAQAPQAQAQAPAPAAETPMHEIGAADAAQAPAVPPAPKADAIIPPPPPSPRHGGGDEDDRVSVSGSTYVGPDETVAGNAVAVMGPVKVDGTVEGNAVAVMGSNTVNGTVHGNTVCVLGIMRLGPKARVDGNVVCVVGNVIREPGSYVGGHVVTQAQGLSEDSGAYSWWHHGLRLGRPLAFGPHLLVFWFFVLCQVALYLLLAAAFPRGIAKCGDTLAHRPGITFLTGVLAILGLPVLFILLLVTVVGIPVALVVLPLSVMAAVVFGKASIYSYLGRSILGRELHPAVALLVGVAIMMVIYLIPFLGLAIWLLVGFLGFACAVTTLFASTKSNLPPPPPLAGGPAAPAAMAAAGPQDPSVAAPVSPVAQDLGAVPPPLAAAPQAGVFAAPVPPVFHAAVASQAGLPRAGFWIRMTALLLDIVLVAIVVSGLEHTTVHLTHGEGNISGGNLFPIAIAAYGAILWKLKGSTIGGIIFGLSVVRTDDRPMDWTTSIVRALACFFSMIAAGLGFIWIAFDANKQAWHDKIAGTVVVRHPKAVSLV